jgi:hypothetical protein
MTNDLDNATIAVFRSSGRLLARGIAVKVPAVPRSTRLRVELGPRRTATGTSGKPELR